MPIDPIRVLPKFTPIPGGGDTNIRFGERYVMEMIQNEMLTKREAAKEYGDSLTKFTDSMGRAQEKSIDFDPEIPIQNAALNKRNEIMAIAAEKVKNAGGDSLKVQEAQIELQRGFTDPVIQAGIQDKTAVDSYNKFGFENRDHLDQAVVKKTHDEIYNKNRKTPMTVADFNLGAHTFDIRKYAEDVLTKREAKYDKIEYDKDGNITNATTVISLRGYDPKLGFTEKVEDAKTRLYGETLKDLQDRDGGAHSKAELEQIANDAVNYRFEKNQGTQIKSLKSTPQEKAAPATDEMKAQHKMNNGMPSKTPGYETMQLDENGDAMIFPIGGGQARSVKDAWDDLSDKDKQEFRKMGPAYDFDKYVVAGSNKRINGEALVVKDGTARTSIGKGLSDADNAFASTNGALPHAEVSDDGTYIETNDPQVLKDKLGLTVSVDKKTGKYSVTDKGGKVTEDGSGMFSTQGGASWDKPSGMVDKILGNHGELIGSERLFRVKISAIKKPLSGTATNSFSATGDITKDTASFIGQGESGGDYNAVNGMDGDKWVSISMVQMNNKDDQTAMYLAGGKDKEWKALAEQIPNMDEKERVVKIKEIYNSMTDDQKRAFEAKHNEIAETKYYRPIEAKFEKDGAPVPDALRPLIRDMTIQHTGGMLSNAQGLYEKVKKVLASDSDLKTKAEEISRLRADHVNDNPKLSRAQKDSIIQNRIFNSLDMTNKIIDSGKYGDIPSPKPGPSPKPIPKAPAKGSHWSGMGPGKKAAPAKEEIDRNKEGSFDVNKYLKH